MMKQFSDITDVLFEELSELRRMEQISLVEMPVIMQSVADGGLKQTAHQVHRQIISRLDTIDAIFRSFDYSPSLGSGTIEKDLFKKAKNGIHDEADIGVTDTWIALCLHELSGVKKERYEALSDLSRKLDSGVMKILDQQAREEQKNYLAFSAHIKSLSESLPLSRA